MDCCRANLNQREQLGYQKQALLQVLTMELQVSRMIHGQLMESTRSDDQLVMKLGKGESRIFLLVSGLGT